MVKLLERGVDKLSKCGGQAKRRVMGDLTGGVGGFLFIYGTSIPSLPANMILCLFETGSIFLAADDLHHPHFPLEDLGQEVGTSRRS